jgi:trigger factor
MDVKKLFTPDLVRNLMDSAPGPRPSSSCGAASPSKALAEAEDIRPEAAAIEAKVKEVSQGLSDTSSIDPVRLREAVGEDLLRETLLEWLEANSTVSEKAPEAEPAAEADDQA